jgi:cell division protein FtsB
MPSFIVQDIKTDFGLFDNEKKKNERLKEEIEKLKEENKGIQLTQLLTLKVSNDKEEENEKLKEENKKLKEEIKKLKEANEHLEYWKEHECESPWEAIITIKDLIDENKNLKTNEKKQHYISEFMEKSESWGDYIHWMKDEHPDFLTPEDLDLFA